jgi:uncharacterized membrane protein YbhN (UPF0104 family)
VSHALAKPGSHAHAHRRHHWLTPAQRRTLGQLFALVFFGVVAWLVFDHARNVDWHAVRDAVWDYPATTLAAAIALAFASYLTYASYELVARRYAHHELPAAMVLGVGLVSYAFNLNLGSLIGAFGLRWRLYTRLGLRQGQVGRIIALNIVTNWSGYLLLAGIVLATRAIELPQAVAIGGGVLLQVVGIVMATLPLLYVVWCGTARRRDLTVRHHHFRLPGWRMALTQLALSSLNWALIGAVVWILLPGGLPYGTVLATLLLAGIAGVITHVPGGLGVIEAVFVAVLGSRVPQGALIAALLVYRAVYYLLPLAMAAALHLGLEASARRQPRRAA